MLRRLLAIEGQSGCDQPSGNQNEAFVPSSVRRALRITSGSAHRHGEAATATDDGASSAGARRASLRACSGGGASPPAAAPRVGAVVPATLSSSFAPGCCPVAAAAATISKISRCVNCKADSAQLTPMPVT